MTSVCARVCGQHVPVNCFLNSEELILLQPMALICEACGTQRHKDVAKFKVWFGLVLLFLI